MLRLSFQRKESIKPKRKLKLLTVFSLIAITILATTLTVYADDHTTRSIVGDYFNEVFGVELGDGTGFFDTDASKNKRAELNNKIFQDETTGTRSLYDRFGGGIKFVPYYGETKITTGLADRFYSKFADNDAEFSLSLDDIKKFFETPAISNHVVYDGRPNLLDDSSIENGARDTRVFAYGALNANGGCASMGNLPLMIGNFIVEVVSYLSGNQLFTKINDIWIQICDNGGSDLIKNIAAYFLPLVIAVSLFYLIRYIIKIIHGQASLRRFIPSLIGVMISLGLVFSLMTNPTAFSEAMNKVVGVIDDTLDKGLNFVSDEVIKSDDTSNIRTAYIWKTSIFEPWCQGMFGDKYENLYTQFDDDDSHKKMDQTNDDITGDFEVDEPRYSSAQHTGDVVVKIGDGEEIRNWAALAWSTQSIYHIDAVNDATTEDNKNVILADEEKLQKWPKALHTVYNDQIYLDDFRWIDAKLDISPEYYSADNVYLNYSKSKDYEQHFIAQGTNALYLACLLFPIAILAIRKLKEALLLIVAGVRLCYYSLMNFILPDRYDVLHNLKKTFRPLYDYFWWSIIVFLAVVIYGKMVGHGIVSDLIWVAIGIYLNKFRPIRTPAQLIQAVNNVKQKTKEIGYKVKSKVNNVRSRYKAKHAS